MATDTLQAESAPTNPLLAWQTAMADYEEACAELERFDVEVMGPAIKAHKSLQRSMGIVFAVTPEHRAAIAATGIDAAQDALNDLVSEKVDALTDAFMTPAPDLAAVAWKLDAFAEQGVFDDHNAEEVIRAIGADVRRLSANLSTIAESVGLLAASCPAPAWSGAIGRQAERIEEGIAAH